MLKKIIAVISTTLLLAVGLTTSAQAAQVSGLSSSQNNTVNKLFKAIASSNPDTIAAAKRKYVANGTPAYFYVEMIENHFSTVRYFRGINSYGMPTGVASAAEPKGRSAMLSRGVRLNSPWDPADGFHSNFKFNKNGKLKNWTVGTISNQNRLTLRNRILPITSSISQNGFLVDGGYIYKEPSTKATAQLRVKNVANNLKSWSFAGGNYGGPDNRYIDLSSSLTGCLYMEQTAFFEAQLSSWPALVAGTEAVINPPVFNGCGNGASSTSAVFRFQTG